MTRLRMLLAVIPMTAALAACSNGSADSGSSGGESSAGRGDTAASAEMPAEAAGRQAAQDRAEGSGGGSGGGSGSSTARARTELGLDRAVISSGTVSLLSEDVAEARREVQRIVDGARGQVSEENTESDDDGDPVYARLVVRVPAPAFDDAMTSLEGVAKLRSSQRTAEDVTTQVIDTEARLRAQQASLERVEALFGRADRLQQIVWIESQLTQRQAELDSLRQQQTWLADQTSLSTITVDIERTPEKAAKKQDADTGFLAGLTGGWKALAATATVLATVAGALLPFVVLLLVVGLPIWIVLRGARRRRTAAQA